MHLAQLNVAQARGPMESSVMREFAEALEAVNALAEASDGFVWRLQDDSGDATAIRLFDDETILVNLSVWTSIAALSDFVFRTGHAVYLRRRREWFEPATQASTVLWWINEGAIPSGEEAVERLALLREHGPTAKAFTFRTAFDELGRPLG